MLMIDFWFDRASLQVIILKPLVIQRYQSQHYYQGKNSSNKTASQNYVFILKAIFIGHDNNFSGFGLYKIMVVQMILPRLDSCEERIWQFIIAMQYIEVCLA